MISSVGLDILGEVEEEGSLQGLGLRGGLEHEAGLVGRGCKCPTTV